MADVWRALNSLAGTMGRRGGISEAMLAGADTTLALKRADWEINKAKEYLGLAKEAGGREQERLKLAQETAALGKRRTEQQMRFAEAEEKRKQAVYGLGLPELERQAAENKYLLEPIHINQKDYAPKTAPGMADYLDSGLDKIHLRMLSGTGFDEQGFLVNKKGEKVSVPRWKWEGHIRPQIVGTYVAMSDPMRVVQGQLWDAKQKLAGMQEPGIPESEASARAGEMGKIVRQIQKLEGVLKDKDAMAGLYANQAALINEELGRAIGSGLNPKYMALLSAASDTAQKKFAQYAGQDPDLEKKLIDLQVAKQKLINQLSGKDLTNYQKAMLSMRAQSQASKEAESLLYGPKAAEWKKNPEKMDEWIKDRAEKILNDAKQGGAEKEDYVWNPESSKLEPLQ